MVRTISTVDSVVISGLANFTAVRRTTVPIAGFAPTAFMVASMAVFP